MRTEPAKLLALRIPEESLQSLLCQERPMDSLPRAWPTQLDVSDRNVAALLAEIRFVSQEVNDNPSLLQSTVAAHLEIQLKSLCVRCFSEASRDHVPDSSSITRGKFSDLEFWIHANLEQPISNEILAQRIGCSFRSLQMAFQRYRNCTPKQFVRQTRLWAVRRTLREPGETRPNISEVAYHYGFVHLGRFAQYDREAFGETPSETLRQTTTGCRSIPAAVPPHHD